MVVGVAHRPERGVVIGYVKFDRQDRVAVIGGEGVEGGDVARRDGDAVARPERRLRERTTEAARRASDEPGAIGHAAAPTRKDARTARRPPAKQPKMPVDGFEPYDLRAFASRHEDFLTWLLGTVSSC